MNVSFEITRAQLRVASAICSNLAVIWLVAGFATNDLFVLTRDIFTAIVFVYLATKIEEQLDEYL